MPNLQSVRYFLPETLLLVMIAVIVLVDIFTSRERRQRVVWLLSLGAVISAGLLLAFQDSAPEGVFHTALAVDNYSRFFKWIFLLSTGIIILVSPHVKELDGNPRNEYYLFILVVLFGMFLMASALDLIIVYLSIEIVSIASFILAGFLKSQRLSSESSLKYVIYGALSSGVMLYGFSLLYGLAGTTNIFDIQQALSDPAFPAKATPTLLVALLLILTGFGYKISMVPFHFWTPDVYQGAPITITAYLAVATKAAGFALALRFLATAFGASPDLNGIQSGEWLPIAGLSLGPLMAIFAAGTMTVGNILAIQQNSVKRLLAYSSIAHAGYMLMAATILNGQAFKAIMFYLVIYLFMTLGAFLVAIFIHNKYGYDKIDD